MPESATLQLPVTGPDASLGAALFIAQLYEPTQLSKRQKFLAAIAECSKTSSQHRKLGRSARRAINHASSVINERRIPAARIASELALALEAQLTTGQAIQISVADDSTVRSVALLHLPHMRKYNTLPNFFHHVWEPSKPVLHLAIAFDHHAHARPASDQPRSLVSLIALPDWLPAAVSNAEFHALRLCRVIPDLPLIALNRVESLKRADLPIYASRYRNLVRLRRIRNGIARALQGWR